MKRKGTKAGAAGLVTMMLIIMLATAAMATTLTHYKFTSESLPSQGSLYYDIAGMAVTGSGQPIAVGKTCTQSGSSNTGRVLSRDPATGAWHFFYQEAGVDFLGACTIGDKIWAVGADNNYGLIRYFDGTSWSAPECPKRAGGGVTFYLRAVSAADPSHVWAVGKFGDCVYFDGTSWTSQGVPDDTYELYDVEAVSYDLAYAVGSKYVDGQQVGVVMINHGSSWSDFYVGGKPLYGIDAQSWSRVFACGDAGTLISYNGSSWSPVDANYSSSAAVLDVAGLTGPVRCMAVDADGKVLTAQGSTVSVQDNDFSVLTSVVNIDNAHVFVSSMAGVYQGTYEAPQVGAVAPSSLDADTQPTVQVYGSFFRSGAGVKLMKAGNPDIAASSVTVLSEGQISATFNLTGAATGLYDLRVTNDDGQSGTLPRSVTVKYSAAPTVASISPARGTDNGVVDVTISGSGFHSGTVTRLEKQGQVAIAATNLVVKSASGITCGFDLNGAATGAWDVVVQNSDAQSGKLSGGFAVQRPAPTLTSVDPAKGDNSGPVPVANIAGSGFRPGASARLSRSSGPDITATDITVRSASSLTCTFDLTGAAVGAWDLVVRNDDGQEGRLADAFTVEYPAPQLVSISPGSAYNTGASAETVSGKCFRQGATVKLTGGTGDMTAIDVTVVSSSQIKCSFDLLGKAAGTCGITVQNDDGKSSSLSGAFTIKTPEQPQPEPTPVPTPDPNPAPSPNSRWYLAEGSTGWGFSTYMTIANPNDKAVVVGLEYQTSSGPVKGGSVQMAPRSQATVNPQAVVGDRDFSTVAVCDGGLPIALDRTMSWGPTGGTPYDRTSSIGVTAPQKAWYLAEGSSSWGFETWLLVQNPNAQPAECTLTYMVENSAPVVVKKTVPAKSRASFDMADDIGACDASISVQAAIPVIAERSVYRNNRTEGHESVGATAPSRNFYLAEGTTRYGFTTYVLVQNPNDSADNVTLTYMTPAGPVQQAPFTMGPRSRKTVKVNDFLAGLDFSTLVSADRPVIAERAMYWTGADGQESCHDSVGLDATHTSFCLPDGQTSGGCETFTLVQNPNGSPVEVELTYLTPDGNSNLVLRDTIAKNSRKTYNMADKVPSGRAGVMVRSLTSGRKIVVERSMYWDGRGSGTDTIGGFSD
jgi:hypothetical protein